MRLSSLILIASGSLIALTPLPGAAGTENHVVIELAGSDRGYELRIAPDPLIVGRDRTASVWWRLDSAARQAAATVEVHFDSASPFAHQSASGSADSLITLGSMRYPLDLESSSYSIRLLDAGGSVVAVGHGTVEVRHRTTWPRRAYLIAGAAGVILLLFNYLERKPLTRTNED